MQRRDGPRAPVRSGSRPTDRSPSACARTWPPVWRRRRSELDADPGRRDRLRARARDRGGAGARRAARARLARRTRIPRRRSCSWFRAARIGCSSARCPSRRDSTRSRSPRSRTSSTGRWRACSPPSRSGCRAPRRTRRCRRCRRRPPTPRPSPRLRRRARSPPARRPPKRPRALRSTAAPSPACPRGRRGRAPW